MYISPEEVQCYGRVECLLRQSGDTREARMSGRDLSPANPPSNRDCFHLAHEGVSDQMKIDHAVSVFTCCT